MRGDVTETVAQHLLSLGRAALPAEGQVEGGVGARAESCLWSGEVEAAMGHAEQASVITSDPMWKVEARTIHTRAAADLAERARMHGQPVAALPTGTEDDEGGVLTMRHPRIGACRAAMLAELSRRDGRRDPRPWRDAVAAWDDAGDPYHAAYCRWRLAHALLGKRAGRPEAAGELDAAQRTAARLQARPLLAAVERLAAAARLRLDGEGEGTKPRPTGPVAVAAELGLTHRELEIVPLLVAGRTNAEIAQALVISPRTVGVHVSRILMKLGATRRTEAADIARRRGLVSG